MVRHNREVGDCDPSDFHRRRCPHEGAQGGPRLGMRRVLLGRQDGHAGRGPGGRGRGGRQGSGQRTPGHALPRAGGRREFYSRVQTKYSKGTEARNEGGGSTYANQICLRACPNLRANLTIVFPSQIALDDACPRAPPQVLHKFCDIVDSRERQESETMPTSRTLPSELLLYPENGR